MVLRAVEQNAIDRSSLQQFDDDIQPFVLGGPKVDSLNVGVSEDNLCFGLEAIHQFWLGR